MTSVTVISAVIARIEHLKVMPSLKEDANKLQSELQTKKRELEENKQQSHFVDFEKEIVQLCYEIDDSVAELEMRSGQKPLTGPTNLLHRISKTIIKSDDSDLKSLTSKLSKINHNTQPKTQSGSTLPYTPQPGTEGTSSISANSSNPDGNVNNKSLLRTGEDRETKQHSYFGLPKSLWRKKSMPISSASSSSPHDKENDTTPETKEENNSTVPGKGRDVSTKQSGLTWLKSTPKQSNPGAESDSSNPNANVNNISTEIKEENNSPVPQSEDDPEDDLATTEKKVSEALQDKDKYPVVCIWGKSGVGKSTSAKKVFNNLQVGEHFRSFAWVSVKLDFQTKKVLRDILLQLLPEGRTEDIMAMDEFKLTRELFKVHDEKSCLVVLEDIRTVEDWQSIRVAFPTMEQSQCKILITTMSKEVKKEAESQGGTAYKMNPLTETECFNLLRDKAEIRNEEWENFGKTIFSLSGGARLPAIILGKSLKTMEGEARNRLLADIDKKQGDGRNALELSYEVLSHELKPCLLYMGQFPEGREMELEELYCMLSAENLIIPSAAAETEPASASAALEEILGILKQRSMVQVKDVLSKRKFRSCKLHDQIRDFCKSQGSKEDFFEIVEFKEAGNTFKGTTPRLAIYLNEYVDENPTQFCIDHGIAKKLRSLLIFDTHQSAQKSTWPSAINDLKEFIRLRVVDFNGTDFRIRKVPKGIDKLVLLKYLSFRGCWLEELPSCISKLQCLETLDLHTNCKITIPDVLHTLTRLRHLYFPSEYDCKGKTLQLNGLENLEILVNLDTSVCQVKDLLALKNLLILTTLTHGHYEDLNVVIECLQKNKVRLQYSSVTIKNFHCYTKDRRKIFNDLLQCESLHRLHIEGQIDKLPKDVKISPSLTEMIFDGSELSSPKMSTQDDHPMEVLGKHEELQSLVLSNDAFIGHKLSFSAKPKFPNLKILKLLNLSKVKEVKFENNGMPQLSTLVIQNCRVLKKPIIPEELKRRVAQKVDGVYLVQPTLSNNQEN